MTRNENVYAQDSIFSIGAINSLPIFYLCLVSPYQGSGSLFTVQLQCLNGQSMGWHAQSILGVLVEMPLAAWPC